MKTASDSVAGMAAPTCLVQMKVSHCNHIVLLLPLILPLHDLLLFLFFSFSFSFSSPQVQDVPTHTQQMVSVRNINVEFSKETLETMLDGLGKIRDQLSSVAKTS